MNQWPFNHTKHTRNREILGANENGQIQKNRKTEEIPIGHSSARKQRAQNFSARKKKPEIGDGKVLYHNIAAGRVRGGAL